MPTSAQLATDEAIVFNDFPTVSASSAGDDFAVLILTGRFNYDPITGGFTDTKEYRVASPRESWPTPPTEGQQAVFKGDNYTIVDVEVSDDRDSIRFVLRLTD